ncbi:MAG: RagB/SusD family nutrient uptake outer membrane protein [Bacteroidetes bacterium]|nr:RagB/SusD family nutrient uptake outer membrane protein [Bacteroidota bacterium]MCL6102330.1 RagB/SusD family nutrient uptake outer membrane protein [Bacteroidota bacterium]
MKKIIYFLSIFFLIIFYSCESLIDEKVYTNLSSTNLFTSESGCEAALTGVYASFFDSWYYGNVYPELICNLTGLYTEKVKTVDYNTFAINSATPYISQVWQRSWQIIGRANDVLYNVSRANINIDTKNRILGEAYFIRAKTYFDNVRLWGALPLRLEPASQENINVPRSPSDTIYAHIIADLDSAKRLLPEPGNNILGRPHRYAAYALAEKVYLTLAGNNPSSPYWQKSLDEGLVVYNSNAYRLVRPYKDLWDVNKQNSTESIFEIQGSALLTAGGSLTKTFLPLGSTLTPLANTWGRAQVNKEVYNQHVTQYKGDPRIDATFLDSSYVNNKTLKKINIYPVQKTGVNSYVYIMKYVDPAYVGSSNCNFIYLRYADVLLMLAEAENEINGPAGAYRYVNQVLARARDKNGNGNTDAGEVVPADWSGMTKDQFRDRIMAERGYELIGELHEYFDVRRRGKDYFKKILEAHNTYGPNLANKEYIAPTDDVTMERIMLLPIPQSEIGTNTAITIENQNPGY